MIKHKQARPNPKRNKILRENAKIYGKDGLTNLRYVNKKGKTVNQLSTKYSFRANIISIVTVMVSIYTIIICFVFVCF